MTQWHLNGGPIRIENKGELENHLTWTLDHPNLGARALLGNLFPNLTYHNQNSEGSHTLDLVVPAAVLIGYAEHKAGRFPHLGHVLSSGQGAALHDVAFPGNSPFYDDNELQAMIRMQRFFKENGNFTYTPAHVGETLLGIYSTNPSVSPLSPIGAVIKDADLVYLAKPTRVFIPVEASLEGEVEAYQDSILARGTRKKMVQILGEGGILRKEDDEKATRLLAQSTTDQYLLDALVSEGLISGKLPTKELRAYAWAKISHTFMTQLHKWHTTSAKDMFSEQKEKNVKVYAHEVLGARRETFRQSMGF